MSNVTKRLDNRLECPNCQTIYLALTQNAAHISAQGPNLNRIFEPKAATMVSLSCTTARSFGKRIRRRNGIQLDVGCDFRLDQMPDNFDQDNDNLCETGNFSGV